MPEPRHGIGQFGRRNEGYAGLRGQGRSLAVNLNNTSNIRGRDEKLPDIGKIDEPVLQPTGTFLITRFLHRAGKYLRPRHQAMAHFLDTPPVVGISGKIGHGLLLRLNDLISYTILGN